MTEVAETAAARTRPVLEVPPGDERDVQVTILLPADNEEAAIGSAVRAIRESMAKAGLAYEILVVDDMSSDRTAEIAEETGARVIRRPVNGGSPVQVVRDW